MFIRGHKPVTILLIFIVILLLAGCSSSLPSKAEEKPDQDQLRKLQAMNAAAETLYRYTKDKQYPEALAQLEQFTNVMTGVSYAGITSPEGLNALTSLVADSRRSFNQVKPDERKLLIAATSIRLAADALSHKEKPLWMEYRKSYVANAERVRAAIKERNGVAAIAALQAFHSQYLIMKPAILISREAALAEKVDSWFIFMNGLLSQAKIDFGKATVGIGHSDALISELFRGGDAATTTPPLAEKPPILWASMLAGAIVSVLFYVGYKKYKYMTGRI